MRLECDTILLLTGMTKERKNYNQLKSRCNWMAWTKLISGEKKTKEFTSTNHFKTYEKWLEFMKALQETNKL